MAIAAALPDPLLQAQFFFIELERHNHALLALLAVAGTQVLLRHPEGLGDKADGLRRLAEHARLADLPCEGKSGEALATSFIARVRQLSAAIAVPAAAAALREGDFERIVDNAFAEAHVTHSVPRYFERTGALAVLQRLLPAQGAAKA